MLKNNADRTYKQRNAASRCTAGNAGIKKGAKHKENHVSPLAAKLVGQTGPNKATTDVEQAKKRGKTGRNGGDGGELYFVQLDELFTNTN